MKGLRTHVKSFSLHISGSVKMKYGSWKSDKISFTGFCKLILNHLR